MSNESENVPYFFNNLIKGSPLELYQAMSKAVKKPGIIVNFEI